MPRPELPFSKEYRDLILERDWLYFMKEDPVKPEMSDQDMAVMQEGFDARTAEIRKQYVKNKKQCRLMLEGVVRLQWSGGFLPAYLKIDGYTKGLSSFDYKKMGKEWASFAFWQKLERRRRFWQLTWDKVTKAGALLAILLSILKLIEAFSPDK